MSEMIELAMLQEMDEIIKTAGYAKDFAAGIDPFGAYTSRYGQEAQRKGLSRKTHRKKQMAGVAGGVVGGAVVVPSAIHGLIGAGKGLASGGGVRGMARGAVSGAVRGAKYPLESVYRGTKAVKTLNRAAKTTGGVSLTKAQKKNLRYMSDNASVDAARDQAEKALKAGSPLRTSSSNRISQDQAKQVLPGARKELAGGYAQLGLGGAIGAGGAHVQYQKGRDAEKEFQSRLKKGKSKAASSRLPADDSDEGTIQTEDLLSEEGRKNCLECGAVCQEDDNHCRKCGAKQIITQKAPKSKKNRIKTPEENEDEEEGTGGKNSAASDMDKESAVKQIIQGIKAQPMNALRAAGGLSVLGAGTYGAVKVNKWMKPKKPVPQQRGMVRTAAEKPRKPRKRGLNPVHRIRSAKRLRLVNAFLGKEK